MIRFQKMARRAAIVLGYALAAALPCHGADVRTDALPATVPGSKPTPGCRIDYTLPSGFKRNGDPCEVRVDPRGRLKISDVGGDCGIARTCPNLHAQDPIGVSAVSLSPSNITDGRWRLFVGDTMSDYDCYDTPGMHQPQGSAEIQIVSVDPPHGSVHAKVDCVPNVPGQGRKGRDSIGAKATIDIVF